MHIKSFFLNNNNNNNNNNKSSNKKEKLFEMRPSYLTKQTSNIPTEDLSILPKSTSWGVLYQKLRK